jgi:hypothetical protein
LRAASLGAKIQGKAPEEMNSLEEYQHSKQDGIIQIYFAITSWNV